MHHNQSHILKIVVFTAIVAALLIACKWSAQLHEDTNKTAFCLLKENI